MDALEAIVSRAVKRHTATFYEYEIVAYDLDFTTILCDK